jgi:LPS-assembly lipoprotein
MNRLTAFDTNPACLPQHVSTRLCRWALVSLAALMLTACGFRMQSETPLPFDSLYITIPQNTQFGADIRRAIRAASPKTKIVETSDIVVRASDFDPDDDADGPGAVEYKKLVRAKKLAQAKLEQVSEFRNTRQVSLNSQGQIEELELSMSYTFRLVNAKDQVIIPDTTLYSVRNLPYNNNVVQAKETEAATLFKDMQKSMVSRILRRLTAPDVTERWNVVKNARSEDDIEIERVKPAPVPGVIPAALQNPSLTPAPMPINPQ